MSSEKWTRFFRREKMKNESRSVVFAAEYEKQGITTEATRVFVQICLVNLVKQEKDWWKKIREK